MPQGKGVKSKSKQAATARLQAGSAQSRSKKPKRNNRPPKAVRLSQAERRYQAPAPPARPGVSVTIHLGGYKLPPKLARPLKACAVGLSLPFRPFVAIWRRLPISPQYRRPALAAVLVVPVAAVVIGLHFLGGEAVPTTGQAAAAERTEPDFKPLLPSVDQASATQYDGKRNMLGYSSTFSGARLTVSQQPVPARFHQDPLALKAAADSIHATQLIDTAAGPLYVATNQTGDQLAVYANKQVLLFVHSDRKLDDVSWKSFIELLKAS